MIVQLGSLRSMVVCLLCTLHSVYAAQTPAEVREQSKQGFIQRWLGVTGGVREFPAWAPGLKEEELQARYDRLCKEREAVYYKLENNAKAAGHPRRTKEYRKSEQKIKGGYSMPAPFAYNQASPGYNASVVTLGKKQYLTMEAPTKENEEEFIQILTQYGVTDLIRLVPLCEGGVERTAPYWEGHINISPKTGQTTVTLGGREMNYYATDYWFDQQAFDPERLIALVKAVMANKDPQQCIAIHCHAGIGRTGSFLAAYELIFEIDEYLSQKIPINRLPISVDKVVWAISLQRISAVGTFSQYVMLNQLVGIYIDSLKAAQLQ